MNKIFIILFLLIGFAANSQKVVAPQIGSPNAISHYGAVYSDSIQLIPTYGSTVPVNYSNYTTIKRFSAAWIDSSANALKITLPNGNVISLDGSGTSSAAGNYGDMQINRNGQFSATDSFKYNSSGLQILNNIISRDISAYNPDETKSISTNTGNLQLQFNNTGVSGRLNANNISGVKDIALPNVNGSLAEGVTVNGTTYHAGTDGNIDIGTIGGSTNWGDIGGDMSNQTDLIDSLATYIKKDSVAELTTDTHLSIAPDGANLKISLDNIDGLQTTPKFRGQEYYKYSGWSNLDDFTDNTMSATVSGGNIVIPDANVSDFTKYLTLDSINCTNHWKMIMLFKRTANPGGGGSGISLGMQSVNSDAICSNAVYFAGTGTLQYFYNSNGGGWSTGIGGTSSALIYSNGDTIRLVIQRDNQHISVVAENLSNGAAAARQIDLDIDITSGPILPNTARWAIFAQGGTFNVISLTCINNEVQTSNVLVVGDSKTMGFGATNYDSTVTGQLKKWYNGVSVSGGFGDKISDMLLRLPELLSIHAKVVVLNSLGSNDIRFGRSVSATMADYATLRQAFVNDGSTIIDVSPCYESAQDLTALYTSWKSTYGANPNSVDIFNLPHQYGLAGDGIHDTDDTQKAWMKRLWDLNVFEGAKN